MARVLVIGAGPAGLMAAETLQGHEVTVIEAMPSPARKFLMAGKSGLNLSKNEPLEDLLQNFHPLAPQLEAALRGFDAQAVMAWAEGLGQEVFTGSTGRVFPKAMKGSPLLRAWLAQLEAQGVQMKRRWRWLGSKGAVQHFATPEGEQTLEADAVLLALGGASWARLGSDGAWASEFDEVSPFKPANMGFEVAWSPYMAPHFGTPIKGSALHAGGEVSRGEWVVSERGIEGGGLYPLSRVIREGGELRLDLRPDLSLAELRKRLAKPRGSASLANHLRKTLGLLPVEIALLQEFSRPLPADLAPTIKSLVLRHGAARPMDEAISVAGGLRFEALDEAFMLKAHPGLFAAGEMLDWEAPTGGYLLTGCFATGRSAALGLTQWLQKGGRLAKAR